MKLLLDSHISKGTIPAFLKRIDFVQIEHLADWHSGSLLSASDEDILKKCREEGRTFVTFDLNSIPDLLLNFAQGELSHSGIFFASEVTVGTDEPGKIARSLEKLALEFKDADLTNIVRFLPAP